MHAKGAFQLLEKSSERLTAIEEMMNGIYDLSRTTKYTISERKHETQSRVQRPHTCNERI